MYDIIIENASVAIPVFNSSSRSVKRSLFNFATGGRLETDHLKHPTVTAVDNISLSISTGERVGVVGNNGSGKSTFLRMLGGIYVPTKGSCFVNGSVQSLIDINLGINPEATGFENIYLHAAVRGISKKTVDYHLNDIIEFSELGDYIHMPLRIYSSGMQMRLAFAMSTYMTADVLLMDEWLSVGDGDFNSKAESRLLSLIDRSKILIIASHSEHFLRNICSRVIWFDHGRILMDGPAELVLNHYFGNGRCM